MKSMLEYQAISSITLKIGLFHLLVTDYFMYYVVIVDWYKYRWLRRDSLRICNEFPLLSYIFWTQQSYCQSLSARNWVQFHSLIGSQMIKWYVDIHQGQVVNAHSSLNLWNEDFRNSSMIPSKCALTIGSGKTLDLSGKTLDGHWTYKYSSYECDWRALEILKMSKFHDRLQPANLLKNTSEWSYWAS